MKLVEIRILVKKYKKTFKKQEVNQLAIIKYFNINNLSKKFHYLYSS